MATMATRPDQTTNRTARLQQQGVEHPLGGGGVSKGTQREEDVQEGNVEKLNGVGRVKVSGVTARPCLCVPCRAACPPLPCRSEGGRAGGRRGDEETA
eukprot:3194170-Prymnesium_polylepis.1